MSPPQASNRPPRLALARERLAQRRLMAGIRAQGRDLEIPPCQNPRRRRRCQRDPELFLRTYLPRIFYNPFTEDQRDQIRVIAERLRHGGRRAQASARGDGKTWITTGMGMWAANFGLARFIVPVSANAHLAQRRLADMKREYETNETLGADFPEICTPIRALEGANQRANLQTVDGTRTRLQWTGDMVIFPTVAGSAASGTVIWAIGIEGAIRGMTYAGARPDLVIIDDCETRESANSDAQITRGQETIDNDVVGLAGPGRNMPIVYLCTITNRKCLAYLYTDRTTKPAWLGVRKKLLRRMPDRQDLWDQYVHLRHEAMASGDDTARAAHRFYLANRKAMDAGAEVSNPYRFNSDRLPDGSQTEASALQRCYNWIADDGWPSFAAECQNDPVAAEGPESTRIDVRDILAQTGPLPRGTVPAGTDYITAGIDIGGRALHWTIMAWAAGRGAILDYGTTRVHSPLEGRLTDESNLQALRDAIYTALADFRAAADGWPQEGTGELRRLDCCLVDAGWQDDPVYAFIRSSPRGQFRASKGYGTGRGQARYREPAKRGQGRRLGRHWFATRNPAARCWLHNVDSDYWKHYVHHGLRTPTDRPGSLSLFNADPTHHRLFAEQITAELWIQEFVTGRGYREYWDQRRADNHWLDATALACAAAGMLGLPLLADPSGAQPRRGAAQADGSTASGSPPSGRPPPGPPAGPPAPAAGPTAHNSPRGRTRRRMRQAARFAR